MAAPEASEAAAVAPTFVKVYLQNGSSKTVSLKDDPSVLDVYTTVCDKIGLTERAYFFLFESFASLSRKLDPSENVTHIVKRWNQPNNASLFWDKQQRIELKRWNFTRPRETRLADEVALDLFWIQAANEVANGVYIPEEQKLLLLGGIQMQVLFGDFNEARHNRGFLANKLAEYIPEALRATHTDEEWEDALLMAHKQLAGMSSKDGKISYLETMRTVEYYGTTWFQPCKCQAWGAGQIIIGIGPEGFHVLKHPTKELLAKYNFRKIKRFVATSGRLAIEVAKDSKDLQFSFETNESHMMGMVMRQVIAEIEQVANAIKAKNEEEMAAFAASMAAQQKAEGSGGEGGSGGGVAADDNGTTAAATSDAGVALAGGGEPAPKKKKVLKKKGAKTAATAAESGEAPLEGGGGGGGGTEGVEGGGEGMSQPPPPDSEGGGGGGEEGADGGAPTKKKVLKKKLKKKAVAGGAADGEGEVPPSAGGGEGGGGGGDDGAAAPPADSAPPQPPPEASTSTATEGGDAAAPPKKKKLKKKVAKKAGDDAAPEGAADAGGDDNAAE